MSPNDDEDLISGRGIVFDKLFEWTEFFSVGARRQKRHRTNLRKIAANVATHRHDKKKLRWFKGGIFGNIASDKEVSRPTRI